MFFFLAPPSNTQAERFLNAQAQLPYSYTELGATATATLPAGYQVDHNRRQLGMGGAAFATACATLRSWTMFDFPWLDLLWPAAPLTVGTTVGVLAHLPGCHILNACRIVYLVEEETPQVTRFGFAYGTLPGHVERGEERFTIEWHHSDNTVWYDILAISQPSHWLIKLGNPVARGYQRRFARASMARMQEAVATAQ